jgi:hypothetical protein
MSLSRDTKPAFAARTFGASIIVAFPVMSRIGLERPADIHEVQIRRHCGGHERAV